MTTLALLAGAQSDAEAAEGVIIIAVVIALSIWAINGRKDSE